MITLEFTLNGRAQRVMVPTHWTLLQILRDKLGELGTEEGCGEGACGSCTVLVDGHPVRSCLVLAPRIDGRSVAAIDGDDDPIRTAIQQAFIAESAIQCGFCIPGFVMTTVALLRDNPNPDDDAIREYLAGNVCRCGSYPQILAAVRTAAQAIASKSTTDEEIAHAG